MGMIKQDMVKIIGGEFAIEDSMLDNQCVWGGTVYLIEHIIHLADVHFMQY